MCIHHMYIYIRACLHRLNHCVACTPALHWNLYHGTWSHQSSQVPKIFTGLLYLSLSPFCVILIRPFYENTWFMYVSLSSRFLKTWLVSEASLPCCLNAGFFHISLCNGEQTGHTVIFTSFWIHAIIYTKYWTTRFASKQCFASRDSTAHHRDWSVVADLVRSRSKMLNQTLVHSEWNPVVKE